MSEYEKEVYNLDNYVEELEEKKNNQVTSIEVYSNAYYKFIDGRLYSINDEEINKSEKINIDGDEIEVKNDDFGNEYVIVNGNCCFVNGNKVNTIINHKTEYEIKIQQPLTIKVGYGKEFLLEDNISLFIDPESCKLYALRAGKIFDNKKHKNIATGTKNDIIFFYTHVPSSKLKSNNKDNKQKFIGMKNVNFQYEVKNRIASSVTDEIICDDGNTIYLTTCYGNLFRGYICIEKYVKNQSEDKYELQNVKQIYQKFFPGDFVCGIDENNLYVCHKNKKLGNGYITYCDKTINITVFNRKNLELVQENSHTKEDFSFNDMCNSKNFKQHTILDNFSNIKILKPKSYNNNNHRNKNNNDGFFTSCYKKICNFFKKNSCCNSYNLNREHEQEITLNNG